MSDELEHPQNLQIPDAFSTAVATGVWRGRVDKTLETLEKTTGDISTSVKALQAEVTKVVVKVGLIVFFGSVLVSVCAGIVIKTVMK